MSEGAPRTPLAFGSRTEPGRCGQAASSPAPCAGLLSDMPEASKERGMFLLKRAQHRSQPWWSVNQGLRPMVFPIQEPLASASWSLEVHATACEMGDRIVIESAKVVGQ